MARASQCNRTSSTISVRLPCDGPVVSTGELENTVLVDIPAVVPQHTRHVAHVARCERCSKRVVAKLPGATAAGRTVAEVSFEPNVQAMALGLRFEQVVPLENIGAFLGQWYQWYGISITSNCLYQMLLGRGPKSSRGRCAKRCTMHTRRHPP